jgi:intracellular multiplication protein IcmE
LVGQFQRLNKKVMLSFKTFSLPSYDHSVPITAVAIDSNTARTAVSGSVNNHYLLRYGSLFASSFLSGYADALTAGGTSISLFGQALVKQSQTLTPAEQLAVGAGNVGKQYANKMAPNFHRAPTVKIPAGTGIGVLLTSDLQLPVQLTPMYNKFKKMENQYHE